MIDIFFGDFYFLHNDFRCKVQFNGKLYPSASHAYEAARLASGDDWPAWKLRSMQKIIDDKFIASRELTVKLLNTRGRQLIYRNFTDDSFWGVTKSGGENRLGEALMRIRDRLWIVKSNCEIFNKKRLVH